MKKLRARLLSAVYRLKLPKPKPKLIAALVSVLGLALVVAGIALIYVPAALIAGGAGLLAGGLLPDYEAPKARKR